MGKRYVQAVVLIAIVAMLIGMAGVEHDFGKTAEIKEFSAFFSVPGEEIDVENDIKTLIAEKIGAECREQWLVGQTQDEAIASYIANGNYPDFISGDITLYEAGALIPIDLYWEEYPNLRNYMKDEEWERLRQADGHIYWIPQFGIVHEDSEENIHTGEAFWIQTRVLKWAGYPEINTVEEYFSLLEAYTAAQEDEELIPFTILCDDWRYFCLENPPQFLAGYPNDGSCIVDPESLQVVDYNVLPVAKQYFQILNEEYHKGIVDPESFTQTYEEYLDKISSSKVLGMVDQWWQFAYDVNMSLEDGCSYVPLPITMEEGVKNQWHVNRGSDYSVAGGISITVNCQDIPGAFQFLDDLLSDDIQKLRYWGVEGVDYYVDEQGKFYRTSEQRAQQESLEYRMSHNCMYSYFPRVEGMYEDGINAYIPENQQEEFFLELSEDVQECFAAYGCKSYVEMIGSNEQPGPWYPMYSYSDMLTTDSEAGRAWKQMEDVKHQYLPQVIMSEDFEEMWQIYMEEYNNCNPEVFLEDMQKELERRIEMDK